MSTRRFPEGIIFIDGAEKKQFRQTLLFMIAGLKFALIIFSIFKVVKPSIWKLDNTTGCSNAVQHLSAAESLIVHD